MSSIYYSPVTSIWTNSAIGTLVIGQPGAGKTFFGLNVAANEIAMGRRVIVIDPKNDFIKLKNIASEVDIVDVNKIAPGSLNPFTFLDDCDALTLMTIIEIILGDINKDAKGKLSGILQDFVTQSNKYGEYTDMDDVVQYLYMNKNQDVRRIAQDLKLVEGSKYGPLLFTREKNIKPLEISKTKSVVISLLGMPLPSSTISKEQYTAEERFTSSIVYILCKKLNDILRDKSPIPTTFFCDEAHILFGNAEMARIIHDFLAMGRSLNVAVVLMSQSVTHFPDSTPQFMSSKFVFKSAIADATEFFEKYDTTGIDLSTEIDRNSMITTIANLETGQCFYLDHKSRSGIIKIHSNFDTSLLSSNPLEQTVSGELK